MFGWLADLLVKSSVVGSSCPCCNGQKEQLKKMQKAVLNGELEESEESSCQCGGNCQCGGHCQGNGDCRCHNHQEEQSLQADSSEMTMSYHYHL